MKKSHLILILFSIILLNCKNDDCGACFTPPQDFIFEFIDKTSGENIFTNGTYDPQQIQITNNLNNTPTKFTFISENDINLIQLNSIGWETEIVDLKIDISNHHIFDFFVDAERKTEDCCSYTEYKEITIRDADFKLNTQTGIYSILIE